MQSTVTFWLPGHMGIPGNEKAYRLAKIALASSALLPLRIPVQYFKPIIRSFIKQFSQLD